MALLGVVIGFVLVQRDMTERWLVTPFGQTDLPSNVLTC